MYKAFNKKHKYLEQWKRVKRWYKKVKEIENDCKGTDDECLDIIYAFFMNLYHLKDWLKHSIFEQDKNDTKSERDKKDKMRKEIEALFDKKKGKGFFKVCADFVNGAKHLKITQKPRIDSNTRVDKQSVTIKLPALSLQLNTQPKKNNKQKNDIFSYPETKYRWEIKCGGKYYDAYNLAKQCFNGWQSFLRRKKLLPNIPTNKKK